MELGLKDRKKLTKVTAKKYRLSAKKEKSKILDTFTGQTGYGRKYAIHLLANEGKEKYAGKKLKVVVTHKTKRKRVYPVMYGKDVLQALEPVWRAFNYQCGKLLAPFLHANIDSIALDPRFKYDEAVLSKLRTISAATIDRLLKKAKAAMKIKGASGTKGAKGHIKSQIPVMSHFECKEQGPGVWQIDLVQHDGGNASGEFCYTLTITEVNTPWTRTLVRVHYALKNKAFKWVYDALNHAVSVLPLPVRILHPDNGGEFINNALLAWCKEKRITLVRSRGGKKNDNCFVEQKNGASVRKIIGYARFSGDTGVQALQDIYTHYDRLLNFFYPCQKLLSKERNGSKVKKTYDKPSSPFDRAIASSDFTMEIKKNLADQKKQINLVAEMEQMQKAIDRLVTLAEPVSMFVPKRGMKPLLFGSLSHGSIS
jgi:transposase InsO family protein